MSVSEDPTAKDFKIYILVKVFTSDKNLKNNYVNYKCYPNSEW